MDTISEKDKALVKWDIQFCLNHIYNKLIINIKHYGYLDWSNWLMTIWLLIKLMV